MGLSLISQTSKQRCTCMAKRRCDNPRISPREVTHPFQEHHSVIIPPEQLEIGFLLCLFFILLFAWGKQAEGGANRIENQFQLQLDSSLSTERKERGIDRFIVEWKIDGNSVFTFVVLLPNLFLDRGWSAEIVRGMTIGIFKMT